MAPEFDSVFQKGRRYKTDLFLFVYLAVADAPNKLGLITSKKKLPTAVKRNTVRRLIRECFRLHQPDFQHYHIVVMAHHTANQATPAELTACLDDFFHYLIKRSKRAV